MAYNPRYSHAEPSRAEVDAKQGPVLLEFGAVLVTLLPRTGAAVGGADEKPSRSRAHQGRRCAGKPLGRSFRVKLWPNLVFMRDGQVLKQFARPDEAEIREGLEAITAEVTK